MYFFILLGLFVWSAVPAQAQIPPTNCANQPAGLTIIRNTPFDAIPGDNWFYSYPDFNPGAGIRSSIEIMTLRSSRGAGRLQYSG